MKALAKIAARCLACRKGHTGIEYGMIAALVVIGLIVSISGIGGSVEGMFNELLPAISAPTP